MAHRQALDYPQAVTKLCVLDIVPTHTVFDRTDRHLAAAYWHWFFFQAPDLPELMLSAAPEAFLRAMFRALAFRAGAIGAVRSAGAGRGVASGPGRFTCTGTAGAATRFTA